MQRREARSEDTMHILWMLIIGLVAGAVARLIMPGKDPGGTVITLVLGLAGSFLAGFLGRALHWYHEGQGAGIIGSIVGALILLGVYRLAVGRGLGRVDRRIGGGTPSTTP